MFVFIFRERERNADVRNTDQSPPMVPEGKWNLQPTYVPWPWIEQQNFGVWDYIPTNGSTLPGPDTIASDSLWWRPWFSLSSAVTVLAGSPGRSRVLLPAFLNVPHCCMIPASFHSFSYLISFSNNFLLPLPNLSPSQFSLLLLPFPFIFSYATLLLSNSDAGCFAFYSLLQLKEHSFWSAKREVTLQKGYSCSVH